MDFTDYQPAPSVLERLKDVSFVAVVGPSGVGKTTLINAATALDPDLHLVQVTTSRTQRPGEVNNVDYHFRSLEEMLERIAKKEFVQVAPVAFGPLYATAPEDYAPAGTALMGVLAAAMPTFQGLPFKAFRSVFIVPPSFEIWQERLTNHKFSDQDKAKRFTEASDSFQFALGRPDMTLVINDNLGIATNDFIKAVHGQPPETMHTNQSASRVLINGMLNQLAAFINDDLGA